MGSMRVFQSATGWGLDLPRGKSGSEGLEFHLLVRIAEVFELFCSKQADYGVGNISGAGLPGLATRLSDKIARFRNIALGHDPLNESLRDTLLDIADYGLIALLVHDGRWPAEPAAAPTPPHPAEEKLQRIKDLVQRRGIATTMSQIKEILYEQEGRTEE